jgi:hypothetical protein
MSDFTQNQPFVKPERPKLLGLRRSALLEIVLSLAILLAVDFFFADGTRFWDVNPHPFWFVVLFMSCKYGTKEGLIAALAASAALLIGNIPEQTMAQDNYAYPLFVLRLPLLWLVSSVAFGELRQMHIRERDNTESLLLAAQEREQRIAQSYQGVRQIKEQFELRVAGQMRSSIAAYQAAKTMEALSQQQVLQGFEELVSATLHPQQFSIYLLNENGLELALMHGWKEDDSYRRQFASSDALYQSVIAQRQVPCVARAEDERVLDNQGLLAGPLVDRDTGEVVGMLKIEKINFTDLNLSNLEAFATMGEWAGKALVNARRYQTAKAGSVMNPDHNLFTQSYFNRFSSYIKSLAERLKFTVTSLNIKLVDAEDLSIETRAQIARALAEAVDKALRNVDLAFDHHETGDEYAIMLPATDRKGAEIVMEKIREILETRTSGIMPLPAFSFSIETLYDKRKAA